MGSENLNCRAYEPLISAMLDGELEPNKLTELENHVDRCPGCQAQLRAYEQVNAAVDSLSQSGASPIDSNKFPSKVQASGNNWLSAWRLIPIATAATLLIGLGLTALPGPRPVTADQINPQLFVQPMKDLHLINVQQQRDQELMLWTLGIDLRSLKLEINQLESGSEERQNMADQIDAMIEKVQLFETETIQHGSIR